MTPEQFKAWRERWKLTLYEAAVLLDMGRRQINKYNTGEAPIPKVVEMACKYYTLKRLLDEIVETLKNKEGEYVCKL